MGARSIPVVAFLTLLLIPLALAQAGPKAKDPCRWEGGVDPFTKEDLGQISVHYSKPFIHSYSIGKPREDGSVVVEFGTFWIDTTERWREPVRLLLADGETVVDLVPTEPTAGRRIDYGGTAETHFDIRGVWTREQLKTIARSEGVEKVRLEGPGVPNPATHTYHKKDQMRLVELARCYFERGGEE